MRHLTFASLMGVSKHREFFARVQSQEVVDGQDAFIFEILQEAGTEEFVFTKNALEQALEHPVVIDDEFFVKFTRVDPGYLQFSFEGIEEVHN